MINADVDGPYSYTTRRTSIHAAEQKFNGETLACDRDKPFSFWLADVK